MALNPANNRLTYEYLRNHPDDAARVLERLPAEAVAALFADTPVRLAAPVLAAMLPYTAGRCLALMAAPTAGALLSQCPTPRAGAMLRQLDDTKVEALLAHAPSAFALRVRRLRSYPDDTIGAWVDSDVIALSTRHSVGEAREHLAAHAERGFHRLYLIDERRRLRGAVDIAQLLQADPERTLATLSQPVSHSLSTRMSLEAARRHRGWTRHCAVPVLEPSGEFVGELRLGALHYARHRADTGDEGAWTPALETLTGTYFATVADLVRTFFQWRERTPGSDGIER